MYIVCKFLNNIEFVTKRLFKGFPLRRSGEVCRRKRTSTQRYVSTTALNWVVAEHFKRICHTECFAWRR